MKVKRNRSGKIKVKYTAEEQAAMRSEVEDQLLSFVADNLLEIESIFLMQLHDQLGFGEKRLKKFYDNFSPTIYDMMIKQLKKENMKDYPCTAYLKGKGFEVEDWALERENNKDE